MPPGIPQQASHPRHGGTLSPWSSPRPPPRQAAVPTVPAVSFVPSPRIPRFLLALILPLLACALPLSAAEPAAATFFPLSQVRLLDGPFKRRYETNIRYVLGPIDSDRLLAPYREHAGLTPKKPRYGAWEKGGYAGVTLGHYLSALSILYTSTDDQSVREQSLRRIHYIVSELALCLRAKNSGAIFPGTKADDPATRLPFYGIHKLLAGLRDSHRLAGSKDALVIARAIAGWIESLPPGIIRNKIATEYGGLNEVFADLSVDTGDPAHLKWSIAHLHRETDPVKRRESRFRTMLLEPLYRGEDRLGILHATTQISITVGLAREYELTGDPRYRAAATHLWNHVVNNRSFVIGGNSEGEQFFPPEQFPRKLTSRTCPTCSTYNMLKLTRHLFEWEPNAAQMDFTERALINHILASTGENPGEFNYFFPLSPVAVKVFSKPLDAWWCCVGTGMESLSKFGEQIYARDNLPSHNSDPWHARHNVGASLDDARRAPLHPSPSCHPADKPPTSDARRIPALWINQYIASSLNWTEAGLLLEQETQFPDSDTIRIKITTADKLPRHFTLKLRHPAWCAAPEIKINGQAAAETKSAPSSYLAITRDWHNGDTLELRLPMTLRAEPLPHSSEKITALLYGPNVLAAVIPDAPGFKSPAKQRFSGFMDGRGQTDSPAPLIVAPDIASALERLRPLPGTFAEFHSNGLLKPDDEKGDYRKLVLIPLHRTYEEQYSVYFPILSSAEWTTRVRTAAQVRQKLEAGTLDTVTPGNKRSEAAHALRAQNSKSGKSYGRQNRTAMEDSAFFSYDMAVLPDTPVSLLATYSWGWIWDTRKFEISIDGRKFAPQSFISKTPGTYTDLAYPIPADWTRGKTKVTVRFTARPKAPALYKLRTVRTDSVPHELSN